MQGIKKAYGRAIDYTPASKAVAAGEVVAINNLIGIATRSIPKGQLGAVDVEGCFDVVQTAEIISAGDYVYWNANGDPVGGTEGTGAATTTEADNTFMGLALKTTAATDEKVTVKLAPSFVYVAPAGGG